MLTPRLHPTLDLCFYIYLFEVLLCSAGVRYPTLRWRGRRTPPGLSRWHGQTLLHFSAQRKHFFVNLSRFATGNTLSIPQRMLKLSQALAGGGQARRAGAGRAPCVLRSHLHGRGA